MAIFKFQRAIMTTHVAGKNLILVYNKSRNIQGEFPMPDDTIKDVFGKKNKVFVKGRYNPKATQIEIDEVLPDQGW